MKSVKHPVCAYTLRNEIWGKDNHIKVEQFDSIREWGRVPYPDLTNNSLQAKYLAYTLSFTKNEVIRIV